MEKCNYVQVVPGGELPEFPCEICGDKVHSHILKESKITIGLKSGAFIRSFQLCPCCATELLNLILKFGLEKSEDEDIESLPPPPEPPIVEFREEGWCPWFYGKKIKDVCNYTVTEGDKDEEK